jgi:hypothetical protein
MVPITVLASQAKSINLYKHLRTKGMKWCANVYFNRQCLAANENFRKCNEFM